MREDYEYTSEALLENIFYYMEQLATEKDFIKNIELLTNLGKYIVNAERASFWYRDTEKNEYRTLVALGADCIIVPKGRGIVGEVIEYNRVVISNRPYLSDNFYAKTDEDTGFTTYSILCVPVTNENGDVVGAFQVLNKQGESDEFDEQDAARLSLVAAYSGKALEAQLLLEENRIDPLTGLKNRKGFYNSYKSLKTDASIIICDIDFFKKVNDTYGHNSGDAVLVHIGDLMRAGVREKLGDRTEVFRWGGEEILVLLKTDYEMSMKIAERIRAEIEYQTIEYNEHQIKITATVGVAPYTPGSTPEKLFAIADKNLYIGKRNGKNRVVGHNS